MATITGKRFQMTDGAASPINLFPYTVSEAVYGLNNSISNAISSALSAISLSTYAGSSAIGSSVQPVYYNGSALVATDLSTTYAPYNAAGYVSKAGDTMTGNLATASWFSGTDSGGVYFEGKSTYGFRIQYNKVTSGYDYDQLLLTNGTLLFNNNTVYHSGNSNTQGFDWACSSLIIASSTGSWNASRGENRIRFFYSTSTAPEGSPGAYYSGVSFMTGYNGMQFGVSGSYDNDTLMFRKSGDDARNWGAWRSIYHSGNSNLSSVPWTCSTLQAYGTVQSNSGYFNNTTPSLGYLNRGTCALFAVNLSGSRAPYGKFEWVDYITGNAYIQVGRTDGDTTTYALCLNPLGGNVGIGTTSPTEKLHVVGHILSTGDQIINSDLTLKMNLQDVTYSVSDIAKCRAVTFDWKDGHGHSAGSIAQDWKPLIPELVHGEEGGMTLAYGQIALVNSILEAREIERLKERVAELEKQLKMRS